MSAGYSAGLHRRRRGQPSTKRAGVRFLGTRLLATRPVAVRQQALVWLDPDQAL